VEDIRLGEVDSRGYHLILAAWKGLLYFDVNGIYHLEDLNDREIVHGDWITVLNAFNTLNHTSYKPEYKDMWLRWYQALGKENITERAKAYRRFNQHHPEGTRSAPISVTTPEAMKVREWMKAHPEEVERMKAKYGLR
jgi:hypothetical protein